MPGNSATLIRMAAQSVHPIQNAFAYNLYSGHSMRICLAPTFSAPLSLQCLHYQQLLNQLMDGKLQEKLLSGTVVTFQNSRWPESKLATHSTLEPIA